MTLRRVLPVAACALWLTWPSAARATPARLAKGHTPAWVDVAVLDPSSPPDASRTHGGILWLLSDRQIRVAGAATEHYVRRAFRVESPSGIEAHSELRIDFDPTYERLVMHHVRITRHGRTIDALGQADYRVIQPESDLDKRVYTGSLEGLLFLHDVRVGDVVDYAFTIRGAPTISGGRFAEEIILSETQGAQHLRRRLVVDQDRHLTLTPHGVDTAPTEAVHDGVHEYRWERRGVQPSEDEGDEPSWFVGDPWIDVSEFESWNEVARLSAEHFGHATADGVPELQDLVAEWTKLPSAEDRALAATRFVQDEIRYLGVELGPHSHQPFSPRTVLRRRFGDCKDKSLLLVTLLRKLGIAADAALVNTDERRMLDERLPSPFAFDHAIVRASVGGATYWIDATASLQRGPLGRQTPPPYERALVVTLDAPGLTAIPGPPSSEPMREVDETYTIPADGRGAVTFDVVTTYRGDDADAMRDLLATESIEELDRKYVNYYAATDPKIASLEKPSVRDDADTDTIVVREHYSIPDFWTDGEREFVPQGIAERLKRPEVTRRATPLGVTYPSSVAQHTHIKLPAPRSIEETSVELKDDAIRFQGSVHATGDTVTLEQRFETLRDYVPVAQVGDHLKLLDRIRDAATFTLDRDPTDPPEPLSHELPPVAGWTALAVVGAPLTVVGGIAFARWFPAWRRRRAFQKRAEVLLGEVPTQPIIVPDAAAIESRLARERCACKGELVRVDGESDVRMGERTVRAVRAACRRCGSVRRIYFELRRG
jgi:transglutaminase-like putative cysteine protease